MGFRPTLFTCIAHLNYTLCLLYKGTHVYSITNEIQYNLSVFLTGENFFVTDQPKEGWDSWNGRSFPKPFPGWGGVGWGGGGDRGVLGEGVS